MQVGHSLVLVKCTDEVEVLVAAFETDDVGSGVSVAMCIDDASPCDLWPVMAALRRCVSVGLIPQVKHGASGVCILAVCGSKLDGIGFEKLHIEQTQLRATASRHKGLCAVA